MPRALPLLVIALVAGCAPTRPGRTPYSAPSCPEQDALDRKARVLAKKAATAPEDRSVDEQAIDLALTLRGHTKRHDPSYPGPAYAAQTYEVLRPLLERAEARIACPRAFALLRLYGAWEQGSAALRVLEGAAASCHETIDAVLPCLGNLPEASAGAGLRHIREAWPKVSKPQQREWLMVAALRCSHGESREAQLAAADRNLDFVPEDVRNAFLESVRRVDEADDRRAKANTARREVAERLQRADDDCTSRCVGTFGNGSSACTNACHGDSACLRECDRGFATCKSLCMQTLRGE